MNPHFFTAPFYFAFIWFKVQGSRFKIQVAAKPPPEPLTLVTSQHTPLFSLLPLEGGAPKGRRLALEAVFSHAGMLTPPRFARLPLPEEGARMILNRASPFI